MKSLDRPQAWLSHSLGALLQGKSPPSWAMPESSRSRSGSHPSAMPDEWLFFNSDPGPANRSIRRSIDSGQAYALCTLSRREAGPTSISTGNLSSFNGEPVVMRMPQTLQSIQLFKVRNGAEKCRLSRHHHPSMFQLCLKSSGAYRPNHWR